jgi:hypothetical protein
VLLISSFTRTLIPSRNDASVEGKGDPLFPTESLGVLGSEEEMLIVVPSSISFSKKSSLTRKEPHPLRKQRWIALNEILKERARKENTTVPIAYSKIPWEDVKYLFNPINYVQERREISASRLESLSDYLSLATKGLKGYSGNEAKLLHFIAPVLIYVCTLFDDIEIVVEENLNGKFITAKGRFEFMLKRKNRIVGIVEAKKDDNMEQGMAQDLVGCEVAAEVEGVDIVYGIVINYKKWTFLRNFNDRIEMEECKLIETSTGPEQESLKIIAEKIYGMLYTED